jgi:hypothetical protein
MVELVMAELAMVGLEGGRRAALADMVGFELVGWNYVEMVVVGMLRVIRVEIEVYAEVVYLLELLVELVS